MLKDDIVKNNLLNMITYVEVHHVGVAELVFQTVHIGAVFVPQIREDPIAKIIQVSFKLYFKNTKK
jgi:hypothetical protein